MLGYRQLIIGRYNLGYNLTTDNRDLPSEDETNRWNQILRDVGEPVLEPVG